MRVLITGAVGNIGSRAYRAFLNDGFSTRVLLHRHKLKNPGANPEIVWGDITRSDTLKRAIQDVDAVIHLAAVLPPLTEEKPEFAYQVNVDDTWTIVDLIKEKGNKIPFVYTSSVSVFGPCAGAQECMQPDRTPYNPIMVYARTKV